MFGKMHGMKNGMRHASSLAKYMATTYSRPPITIVRGKGSRLWDADNKSYVDFTAGIAVTALGHSNDGVAAIIAEQSKKLLHCSNLYFNEWAPQLSSELVHRTKTSGGMYNASRVFLCNSGSEANEAALKFARKRGLLSSTDKHEIVAFNGGFHGRTYGALTATKNPKYQNPFAPMVPGFHYGSINTDSSLDLISERTCGVIVEPIQGEGGINVCSPEWLVKLREKCNKFNVTLIYDEIQCGLGRTGDLWAHTMAGKHAHPDILTMAKALGNGFPVGATVISEEVNNALQVGDHGTTYGGNPLASRIALHVLKQIDSQAIKTNVQARCQQIRSKTQTWIEKKLGVTEIRGRGLMLGIQLDNSPQQVLDKCRENGLLAITCGTNTIRIIPALTISETETQEGLNILEEALIAHNSPKF